eukprot:6214526-Pleurochrysis_carterae.AAC.2
MALAVAAQRDGGSSTAPAAAASSLLVTTALTAPQAPWYDRIVTFQGLQYVSRHVPGFKICIEALNRISKCVGNILRWIPILRLYIRDATRRVVSYVWIKRGQIWEHLKTPFAVACEGSSHTLATVACLRLQRTRFKLWRLTNHHSFSFMMEITNVTDRFSPGLSTADKIAPILSADHPFLHRA